MRPSTLAPSLARRGLAVVLGSTLILPAGMGMSPSIAAAAVVGPTAEDPALAEARALYDQGKARFDTFDYEGAVDLWTQAYSKLPDDAGDVRNAMVYNIATAQEKAYDLDKDVQHLRQAILLLESYVKTYKALYKKTDETAAEVDKAEGRIAALKERLEQAERGDAGPPPSGEPAAVSDHRYGSGAVDGIVWSTGPIPPPDPALLEKNQRLAAQEKKTDRMLIASYVLLGVGGLFVLGGASAVAGGNAVAEEDGTTDAMDEMMATTEDANAGRGARGTGYGSLALGGICLVTGFTLLGVGLDRRKKARSGTLVATPVVGPGFAGASMRVRF